MSNDCVITRAHYDYMAARTRGDDEFLAALKREAEKAGIPKIWISPAQASLMQILLKLRGAREIVEVGTLAGYSAITMARALPDGGKVRTVELEDKHADFAEEWIARSDVAGKVEVLRGAGVDVLKTLQDQSADACFLDADKQNYPHYLDECMRILRPGSLVMADNAFAFGQLLDENAKDGGVPHVRKFNDYIAGQSGLHAAMVGIGDGLWVGVKEA